MESSHGGHKEKSDGKGGGLGEVLVTQFLDIGKMADSHDALGGILGETAEVGPKVVEGATKPLQDIASGESGASTASSGH